MLMDPPCRPDWENHYHDLMDEMRDNILDSLSPLEKAALFQDFYDFVDEYKKQEQEDQMYKSEQINELASALCKCQGEMSFAVKDSSNPAYKSKYASLSAVWEAIREPLSKHGLSVVQTIELIDGKTILVSVLMHNSGQWIKSMLPIKTDKDTCQGWGSGITYSRRYALAALVGCVQDDDDGNEAESSKNKKQKEEKKVNLLTSEQKKELHNLSDLCDPKFLEKVMKRLEQLGIDGFENIPQDIFEQMIIGMRKNAESNSKKREEAHV